MMTSRETYDTRGARNEILPTPSSVPMTTARTYRRANAINDALNRSEPAMAGNKSNDPRNSGRHEVREGDGIIFEYIFADQFLFKKSIFYI